MTLTNPSGHPEKSSAIEAYDFNVDSSAQAGVTAPVSHQQQPNRSATNAIGLRQKTATSTNQTVLPPLRTVWLQIRVLPGPPINSAAYQVLFRCRRIAAPETLRLVYVATPYQPD
jgi:hypothetical protein